MKIRDMFKKVEGYNELADVMNTEKAHIWFADVMAMGLIKNGENFKTYAEFRKYVRREYIKEVADFILNSDEFEMNSEKEFTHGFSTATYEVYIEQD